MTLPGSALVEGRAHQLRHLVGALDLRRIGEDAVGIDAVREHVAVAIDDFTALRRGREGAQVLAVGAYLHVRALDHLQIDQARLNAGGPGAKEDGAHEQTRKKDRAPLEVRRAPGQSDTGSATLSARVAFGSAAGLLFCHRSSCARGQRVAARRVGSGSPGASWRATTDFSGGAVGATRSITMA